MIDYREFVPRASLLACIECLWTLRGAGDSLGPPSRILPDGCIEIVLNFAGRFTRHHDDGTCEAQPEFMVVGPMSRWITVQPAHAIDLLGVRFRPAGARPFLRMPLNEIAGRTLDDDEVPVGLDEAFLRATPECSRDARVRIVEDALERRMVNAPRPLLDDAISAAARSILRTGGAVPIDELGARFGLHPRTLERRFHAAVGMAPKMLARITRFQQVFRSIESGDSGWATVAARCGYYDQSHLIRDFRAFAGESPAVLFSRELPLTRAFTRARRVSDSSNTHR